MVSYFLTRSVRTLVVNFSQLLSFAIISLIQYKSLHIIPIYIRMGTLECTASDLDRPKLSTTIKHLNV